MVFFEKKSVGLEIADRSIEVVELSKKGNGFEVSSAVRVKLAPGIVERGRVQDGKKLLAAVQKAFAGAKPRPIKPENVVFGLPESQTYLHVFDTKVKGENELEMEARKQAEATIPLQEDEMVLSWRKLGATKTGARVLLAATSREAVREWSQFFQKAKVQVAAFDIEALATFRGLFTEPPKTPVCVVDIGAATTQIAIFNQQGLQYAYSIPKAGVTCTKEIAKALKVPETEAEEMKKKAGLANPEEQVFQVLLKVLEGIATEARNSLDYYKQQTGEEAKQVVLVGGSAQMKGIADYFSTNLLLKAAVGKSAWLKKRVPLAYIESVGLALRGLNETWEKKDPMFPTKLEPEKEKKSAVRKQQEKQQPQQTQVSGEGYSLAKVVADNKMQRQKVILGALVVVGIITVVGAFWFRSSEKAKEEQARERFAVQFTNTQEFTLEVPVAVVKEEYTSDRVKGSIIEHSMTAGSYAEAVAKSRTEVSKQVEEGDRLWQTPVNFQEGVSEVGFPVALRWLVYKEEGANDLYVQEVEKRNIKQVPYALNTIEKTSLRATENKDIFLLEGKVTLSLNERFENTVQEESPVENTIGEEPFLYVIVLETPTGLLNVREGPGAQFEAFMEVEPADEYILLDEENNWYEIQITGETKGWVSSRFAEIINEE